MATPLTQIAIEVPRTTRKVDGQHLSGAEWEVAGENLLERAIKGALQFTDAENIRLLTGAPDEAIFTLCERYSVVETEMPSWLQRAADAARSAEEQDVVAFLRADVVLKDYAALGKAIEAVRHLPEVDRCEAAMRPSTFENSLTNVHAVERSEYGIVLTPWSSKVTAPMEDFALLCPAFEVMKLRSFTINRVGGMAKSGTAFVWIEEDEQVALEGPLDWLRAEVMLS